MNSKSLPEFTEVSLEGKTAHKLPKKRVYFSDGYLDEYSTDDEDEEDSYDAQVSVDTKNMDWLPYIAYMTWWVGTKAVDVCDYVGGHIAYFLGITAPKFQYELEVGQRIIAEEEEQKRKIAADNAGWTQDLLTGDCPPILIEPITAKDDSHPEELPASFAEGEEIDIESAGWKRY